MGDGEVLLTTREADRVAAMREVAERRLRQAEAARWLGLSDAAGQAAGAPLPRVRRGGSGVGASRPPLTRRLRASHAAPTTLPDPETALDQPPGSPVHPRIAARTSTDRDFAARSLPGRGYF